MNSWSQARAFEVADDDWIGYAVDTDTSKIYRVEMLDMDLNPVINATPTYVKLVNFSKDSSILLDFETGDAIQETDTLGRVTRFDNVTVIREDDVIVQIDSPGGLIDFEVIHSEYEYEIRLYTKDQYAFNTELGLYELNEGVDPITGTSKRFNIKNPASDSQDIDETLITRYWDDRITQWQFQYYTSNDFWEIRTGEVINEDFVLLRREETRLIESQDETQRTDIKRVYNADGTLLSEVIEIYELTAGKFELVMKMEDPDGANLAPQYEYYKAGDSKGKLKHKKNPDGSWEAYSYDSNGRIHLKVESWLDVPYDDSLDIDSLASQAKSTEYSYTSLDAQDGGISQPDKPRTETVRILDVVTERVWHAYLNGDDGRYHEVTERAVSQTSEYGDASNVRSENIYYPRINWGESEIRARRMQSNLSEDGTFVTYDYAKDVDGYFVVTETYTHADAPDAVSYTHLTLPTIA